MNRRWLCGLLVAALTGALPANAAAPAVGAAPWRFDGVPRVVAFGDVHGAYDQLVAVLRSEGLLDADLNWSGAATHLVSVGDLLDRGPGSRAVLDLLMRLQGQAAAAGGAVHVVLGNHESMNLTGDLRYLVAADYAEFAGAVDPLQRDAAFARYLRSLPAPAGTEQPRADFDAEYPLGYFARQDAFAPTGRYGSWLLELPAVVVVNGTAYLHGGLPRAVADSSLDALNERIGRDLAALLATQAQARADGEPVPPAEEYSPLLGADGPLWYRGTALCHALIETPRVERGLAALQAQRVVIGHTPTSDRRVQTRFDGRVVMIDTGMLTSYYHGHPAALEVADTALRVRYAETGDDAAPETADEVGLAGWDRPALEAFLAGAPIVEQRRIERAGMTEYALQLRDGVRQHAATFVELDAKRSAAELAAYRLDVLLGLGLVPTSVPRHVDGDAGVIAAAPDRSITEADRRDAELARPNWCESGNDYQLMYVFDALIGHTGRTVRDITYDRASWRMQLRNNAPAFPTSRKLSKVPPGVDAVVPAALAERLAGLDAQQLRRALGDLLNRRQLDALVARRDELLASWPRSS